MSKSTQNDSRKSISQIKCINRVKLSDKSRKQRQFDEGVRIIQRISQSRLNKKDK